VDVRLINPFVQATDIVFDRMLCCRLERMPLKLTPVHQPYRGLSGVIDLQGTSRGRVVLNLPRSVALGASSVFLDQWVSEIGPDVHDVVGELTNMICGHAKARLRGSQLSMKLPVVEKELLHYVDFPESVRPIRVPFRSSWGPVTLDVWVGTDDTTVSVQPSPLLAPSNAAGSMDDETRLDDAAAEHVTTGVEPQAVPAPKRMASEPAAVAAVADETAADSDGC
jgi:chemotaxis protein CheX